MNRVAATLDEGSNADTDELHKLKLLLQELEWSARSRGLWLTANLIGAASESVSDEVNPRSGDSAAKVSKDRSDRFKPLRIERPNF